MAVPGIVTATVPSDTVPVNAGLIFSHDTLTSLAPTGSTKLVGEDKPLVNESVPAVIAGPELFGVTCTPMLNESSEALLSVRVMGTFTEFPADPVADPGVTTPVPFAACALTDRKST